MLPLPRLWIRKGRRVCVFESCASTDSRHLLPQTSQLRPCSSPLLYNNTLPSISPTHTQTTLEPNLNTITTTTTTTTQHNTFNTAMATSPTLSPALSPALSATSPPRSRASSRGSHLSLDLSSLPPLSVPTPPTNTIIITNLTNPTIFTAPHLAELRDIISQTAAPTTWSPLRSFARIICSFPSIDDAILVRTALDGSSLLDSRIRVYFGASTPTEPLGDQHLQAPESKKMFFISPPPSPPHGWESKNEDPPNQVVVAEDLAHALARLSWEPEVGGGEEKRTGGGRAGDRSTLLFEPKGEDGEMPVISVDDWTDSGDEHSPVDVKTVIPQTQRPPVELMHHA